MTKPALLDRGLLDRPVLDVARDLLGSILVRLLPGPDGGAPTRLAGRIVEVEAYDGEGDLACHAARGRTPRTEPMFGAAGHAYVYLVYGIHTCLNVVTGPVGYPAAVLIRAVEPLDGGDPARASGPGRLTRLFGVGLGLNRTDLCRPGPLVLEPGGAVPDSRVLAGPRIGVEYAGAWARKPWRFGVAGSPALSRPFPRAGARSGRGRPGLRAARGRRP
jgi:DNA-3-methyladenine glycosylase